MGSKPVPDVILAVYDEKREIQPQQKKSFIATSCQSVSDKLVYFCGANTFFCIQIFLWMGSDNIKQFYVT